MGKQDAPRIGHYENFPVASWVLPRRCRAPVRLIYAFARLADDVADEGDAPDAARLAQLTELEQELDRIETGQPPQRPLLARLGEAIAEHSLPIQPFRDLLSAFAQDVTKKRYADFGEVMDYCRRSANPIGRLLLHVFRETAPRSLALSDGICASLQLINFLQDIEIDYRKGRIYLPQDEMERYGIGERQIAERDAGGLWSVFMRHQIERARRMLQAGAPLARVLKGRVGMELRMIVLGGERILKKLHESGGDVFGQRPRLDRRDWIYMFFRALASR
jgi:squalene synthase HpnC